MRRLRGRRHRRRQFFSWKIAGNVLKNPESDQGIQENPRKSKPEVQGNPRGIQGNPRGNPRKTKHYKMVVFARQSVIAGEATKQFRMLSGGSRCFAWLAM